MSAACSAMLLLGVLATAKPQLDAPHEIGGGLPPGFEPSDAAWHPRLQRLFVVSDGGLIASMDADGGSVRTWPLAGDLEGICVADPESDRIYVAIERPSSIVEFDLKEGRTLRTFPFPIVDGAGKKKNKGLEALTFVPDAGDPEGGAFWAGVQSDGSVHVLSIPVRSDRARTTLRELRVFKPVSGASDLAGLDWDPSTESVFAVFDRENLLVVLDRQGKERARWSLPGDDQEGVAVTADRIFIADDGGHRVVRYERAKP
jgi:uncharacterized protein YjiK